MPLPEHRTIQIHHGFGEVAAAGSGVHRGNRAAGVAQLLFRHSQRIRLPQKQDVDAAVDFQVTRRLQEAPAFARKPVMPVERLASRKIQSDLSSRGATGGVGTGRFRKANRFGRKQERRRATRWGLGRGVSGMSRPGSFLNGLFRVIPPGEKAADEVAGSARSSIRCSRA